MVAANERKQEAESRKQKKSQASSQAESESDLVFENEFFKVIRPYSEHAACHFGQGTTWCIAATDSRNYFNQYSFKEDKIFYIIDFKPLRKSGSQFKRFAFEMDEGRDDIDTVWSEINRSFNPSRANDIIWSDYRAELIAEHDLDEDDLPEEILDNIDDAGWYFDKSWHEMIEVVKNHADGNHIRREFNPNFEHLFEKIYEEKSEQLRDMKFYGFHFEFGDEQEYASIYIDLGFNLSELLSRFRLNEWPFTRVGDEGSPNEFDSIELNPQLFSDDNFLEILEEAIRDANAWTGEIMDFNFNGHVDERSREDSDFPLLQVQNNSILLQEFFSTSYALHVDEDGAGQFEDIIERVIDLDENLTYHIERLVMELGWSAKGDYDPNDWKKGGTQDENVGGKKGSAEYPFFIVKGFHKKDYFPGGPDAMKNQLELPLREFFKRWKF